ncbi:MAG: hypothetical protein PGN25_01430 [Methylorubrum populi]
MSRRKLLDKVAKQQSKNSEDKNVNLKIREAALLSLSENSDDDTAYINLKYYRHEHQCLSEWDADQLRAFSAFCRKITQFRWIEIYKTGGKVGSKTGLGYTVHKDRAVLPAAPELDNISPDLTWFELRVTNEARVHGFRCKSAFFLVFLDRLHQVYPG